jgi:rhomboid family GlyGly-CTERM serine protease
MTHAITRLIQGARGAPWITAGLVALSVALYGFAGPAPELFVYDRRGIAAGELWRLVTGHWVHCDAGHALWNIAALALLGVLFERGLGWRVVAALAVGTIAIDAWLWWAMPQLVRYCGLSGILNALLAAGLVQAWRETRDPLLPLVGAGAVVKIAVEAAAGAAVFTHTAWPPVPAVHAIGLLAGTLLVGVWIRQVSAAARSATAPASPARPA